MTARAKSQKADDRAGRCIRLFRPHRWTPWKIADAVWVSRIQSVSVPTIVQMRACVRCGRTQKEDLG